MLDTQLSDKKIDNVLSHVVKLKHNLLDPMPAKRMKDGKG